MNLNNININPETILFLKNLYANNNRKWFIENKDQYQIAQSNMIQFADQLLSEMNTHDELENESGKKTLYRIYNDVRFSKDKAPYNPRFALSLRRAAKYRRGGYYLQIKPGNCFLACGFFAPNPSDLKRIREDISVNFQQWNTILNTEGIRLNFGDIQGSKLTTAPRGFDKDNQAIQLLRQKQFILRHDFTDQEVMSDEFLTIVNKVYKSVRPFFDHMTEILTTNADGELMV